MDLAGIKFTAFELFKNLQNKELKIQHNRKLQKFENEAKTLKIWQHSVLTCGALTGDGFSSSLEEFSGCVSTVVPLEDGLGGQWAGLW